MLCSLLVQDHGDSSYKTRSLSSGYLLISHASDNRRIWNCCLLPENNKENCIWGVWGLCKGKLVRSDHRSRRSYNLNCLITDQKLSLTSRCSKALAYFFKKNWTQPFHSWFSSYTNPAPAHCGPNVPSIRKSRYPDFLLVTCIFSLESVRIFSSFLSSKFLSVELWRGYIFIQSHWVLVKNLSV